MRTYDNRQDWFSDAIDQLFVDLEKVGRRVGNLEELRHFVISAMDRLRDLESGSSVRSGGVMVFVSGDPKSNDYEYNVCINVADLDHFDNEFQGFIF